MKHIETIVIGAGQAGLAASYYLAQYGEEHVVLEQSGQVASGWRNRSWDSLTLVTPNLAFRMPGVELSGDRNGFMPLRDIISFFEDYVKKSDLPILYNIKVLSVARADDGSYALETSDGTYSAKNVVIATGFFQHPKLATYSKTISSTIKQMHSSEYRRPGSVADGAILVVGSGQSGTQIVEELLNAGKKVFLCVGTAGRAPRRYRGKDIIEWLHLVGLFDLSSEQLPPGMGKFDGIPHLSGANGGHTINLHQFAHDGITLLGHLRFAENDKILLASDLHKSLEAIDSFEMNAIQMIDEYIRNNNLDAPKETLPQLKFGYDQPLIQELSLSGEGINTIVWATGYNFDYSMVKLPVVDDDGFPIQSAGVTKYPGLYFVGMPWMPSEKSGFLLGVGDSAHNIVNHIVRSGSKKSVEK
jgi:putative flavoprotein involved in K+ transport